MRNKFLLLILLLIFLVSCSAKVLDLYEQNRSNNQSNSGLAVNGEESDSIGQKEILEQLYCGSDCFLGIVPGKTSFEDANNRLMELGFAPLLMDGETLSSYFVEKEEIIETQIVIKLIEGNQKVSQMRITLELRETSFSDDDFVVFSPIRLLSDHGIPEKIHVNYSEGDELFNLFAIYESDGFLFVITGLVENNSICLSPEDTRLSSLTMVMDDYTDGFSVWDGLGFALQGNEAAVFQMTPEEIFNQAILDQDSCFEVMVNSGN